MPGDSAWIAHVKSVRAAQNLSYKEALKVASATYVRPEKSTKASKKEAKTAPKPPRITSADTHRCAHLLAHPPKKGQSSTMQAYKEECIELLDRMCLDAATKDGLLDYDTRCAKRGSKLKVVDVHGGKVCCGEVSKETMQQKSERLLRIAVKIAEVTTTPKEAQKVVEMAEGIDMSKSTWQNVLRNLFGYVYSRISSVRRPVTLIVMTAAIVLVGYGITSTIVADLTNSVGVWEVGKSMANLSGRAATHAAKTELTKAETEQYSTLINAAVPVVKGAIGALVGGAAIGTLPVSTGVMAGGAALGAMSDAQTVANVSSTVAAAAAPAAEVAGQAAKTTLRVVGEQFLHFLIYSASVE